MRSAQTSAAEREGMAANRFRRLKLWPRVSLQSLFWLSLMAALCTLWYLDRTKLIEQLEVRQGFVTNSWSIDQVRGPPDTIGFGDLSTAWASRSPNTNQEWIIVEFPTSVKPTAVEIYETYNPGAVKEIYQVAANGGETMLWHGRDPLIGSLGGKATFPITSAAKLRRIKILIDSPAVPGWNEIDAVGLVEPSGRVHWASAAWASSSYGTNRAAPRWYWP